MWMMPLHLHVNQKSDYDIYIYMKDNKMHVLLDTYLVFTLAMLKVFMYYTPPRFYPVNLQQFSSKLVFEK